MVRFALLNDYCTTFMKQLRILLLPALVWILFSCMHSQKKTPADVAMVTSQDSITEKIFQLKDTSGTALQEWGYDVFIHNKLMLHQPNIPAVQGNHGFSSAEDAKKVADLVVM